MFNGNVSSQLFCFLLEYFWSRKKSFIFFAAVAKRIRFTHAYTAAISAFSFIIIMFHSFINFRYFNVGFRFNKN